MGTDIHLFLETDYSDESPAFGSSAGIRSFAKAELFVRRNYGVFDALAGTRSRSVGHVDECRRLFPSRGIPEPVSDAVYYRYFRLVNVANYADIAYDAESLSHWVWPSVSPSAAEEWIKAGLSHYAPERCNLVDRPARPRVSHPDWHSSSWLFPDEMSRALEYASVKLTDSDWEFQLVLRLASEIEANRGDGRVRFVFWFDG